jgi:hypothetical protein
MSCPLQPQSEKLVPQSQLMSMVAIGLWKPCAKTKEAHLVLVWCLLLGRWLLLSVSKRLEYISRIRIMNNNQILIGEQLNNFAELKQSFVLKDLNEQKKENWSESECKILLTVLKRHSREILLQSKGGCSDWVRSNQMVFGTVWQEAGPQERQSKVLKTKLAQGGPSGSTTQFRWFSW